MGQSQSKAKSASNAQKTSKRKEKVIYFHLVRHGETDYNQQGKVQGHLEVPLNENGTKQAQALGACIRKHVQQQKIDAVVASPVLRAKQTGIEIHSQLVAASNNDNSSDAVIPFSTMPEFAELHYGDFVGKLLSECNDIVVDLKENKWASGQLDASFPGEQGESFESIIARMKRGFYALAEKYEDGANIIVATHSQCIEAWLVHLNAFGYKDKEIRGQNKNCTISTVKLNAAEKSFKAETVFQDLTVHLDKIQSLNQG